MRRTIWNANLALGWALAASLAHAKVESTSEGIRFTYRNATAQKVFVAGDFNGWSAAGNPMTREGDAFVATLRLAPGEHEYKFVVDGQWFADPENPTTVGSFGNSALRVGAKGELLEMQATSNTPLNPRILLGGRYIGLFVGREDEANGRRFAVQRPDFNIDLDFAIRVSEALDAQVITKIRNLAQGTQLWQTSLQFDRGHLDLHRQHFALRLFDNDGVGTWDDPLHLVGDLGIYHHDFGFDRQGLRFQGRWRGIDATFLYADNFRSGFSTFPTLPDSVAVPSAVYKTTLDDNNENVLAVRLERELRPGLRIAASLRNDRGYNPGALAVASAPDTSTLVLETFESTFERWIGGGADVHLGGPDRKWEAVAEWLYGEASIRARDGVRAVWRDTLAAAVDPLEKNYPLDASQRWTVGGVLRPGADLVLRARVESERHGLSFLADHLVRNRAFTQRYGIDLGLRPSLHLPVRLGLDFEHIDFQYDRDAPWSAQFWFADHNFWMDHFEHRVPVGRYVQLGGADASTWSPWLEWRIFGDPPTILRYEGHVRGNELDGGPKLVESVFKLTWPLRPRLRFYSDTRWARYDEPFLGVFGGFLSTFAELEYRFAPAVSVALSYGVDPFVLDVATNEYGEIGRNQFLMERGATPFDALERYTTFGSKLATAERALEKERRIQVEAIARF